MRSTGIEPPTTRAPALAMASASGSCVCDTTWEAGGRSGLFPERGNLVAHLQRPRFQLQRASGTQGRPQHFPEDPSDAMRVRSTCVLLREAAEQLFCHWDLVSRKLASDGPVTSRFAQTRPGPGRARVSRRAKGPGRPSRWEPSPPPSPPSRSLALSLSLSLSLCQCLEARKRNPSSADPHLRHFVRDVLIQCFFHRSIFCL